MVTMSCEQATPLRILIASRNYCPCFIIQIILVVVLISNQTRLTISDPAYQIWGLIDSMELYNFHWNNLDLKYFKLSSMSFPQSGQPDKLDNELFSIIRRNINSLKEKDFSARRNAIADLRKIVTSSQASHGTFEQIMHMGLKDIIKCYYDNFEAIRESAIHLTIETLSRCDNIRTFLPYIFEALKDRTNCVDLEGIDKVPQKMRPQPGQKPKVMLKVNETCEEIRQLYSSLIRRIIVLLEQDKQEMARHLDDMVNILRALVMDPAPDVQKQSCEVLKIFCTQYKDILLHFTETLGRAVLLPLISKKSKIRIIGLETLAAILWCGLWKYNAFVFQNLIGFRDPNSVPIKDFYEPSNNINYLATFIIDPNVRVRQEFMRHLKVWVCDLNDKYDHHGKLVPYLLSGLFDADEKVRQTAVEAITQIGKQIEEEKEKQFRENKQFAIDAAWTWQGKLVDLPVETPLQKRPSLGARYFIRGHVRKFWPALYKQIRDLNEQNRVRSASLALFGVIFTENYLTQFLDNFIPQLLPSILPSSHSERRVADKISLIFYYIGRYCEQSAYIHLIKSALEGKLIQNEEFIRCSMKGLAMLIKGNLEAIPTHESLMHKKDNVIQLLTMLQECQISGDVYNFNCIEARQIAETIIKGISSKASAPEKEEIFGLHFLTLVKLTAVTYFEELYSVGYTLKHSSEVQHNQNIKFSSFVSDLDELYEAYSQGVADVQQFLGNVFCSPPSLMDSDWKLLVIFYRYFCLKSAASKSFMNLFLLVQDTICECLTQNSSVELLAFTLKFLCNLIETVPLAYHNSSLGKSDKLLKDCLGNLQKFKPIKKVPVYEQNHYQQQDTDKLKTFEQNYSILFIYASKCLSGYFLNKVGLNNQQLAEVLFHYLQCFSKIFRNKDCHLEAVKTIWAIFEKVEKSDKLGDLLSFQETDKQMKYMVPQVIDFCIDRLEEYLEPRLNKLVFDILGNIVAVWPKAQNLLTSYPSLYPNYPQLLEKLFKYSLNERDVETKQQYSHLLEKLAAKIPDWFKEELKQAQAQKRFEKAKLIQEIASNANI